MRTAAGLGAGLGCAVLTALATPAQALAALDAEEAEELAAQAAAAAQAARAAVLRVAGFGEEFRGYAGLVSLGRRLLAAAGCWLLAAGCCCG